MSLLFDNFQTHDPWQWLFVAAALGVAGAIALGWALSRRPAWWEAGLTIGYWSLSTALIGFIWDVAWHADTGRDLELFTVPHTLIVLGLLGLCAAAAAAVAIASHDQAPTGWRWRRLRMPFSALPLGAAGAGAVLGFPLDDLWHAAYGIDVTMWSPTHLLMIGGASLAPLALWLMAAEAGQLWSRRRLGAGAVLLGLSTFQLEFDMGIPQWQLLFQPALIAVASGIGLVAARAALGRGGALLAAAGFLAIRLPMLLLIGGAFGYSWPRFPLYLGSALAVEAAFLLTRARPALLRGLAAGLGAGTAGLATEWIWNRLWYPVPWSVALLPYLWIAIALALAGAVIGIAAGRTLAGRDPGVPPAAVLISLLAVAALLVFHLPARHADPAAASMQVHDGTVELALSPAAAAQGADWFSVLSWQGHAPVQSHRLVEVAPGRFRATGVETSGSWKSMVFLARGDVMEAIPVYMPADPAYRQPAIYPADGRQAFVPASRLLTREFHGGQPEALYLAFGAFGGMILIWVVALVAAYRGYAIQAGGAEESKARWLVTSRGAAPADGEGEAPAGAARATVQS
jgi:hypothetical protein